MSDMFGNLQGWHMLVLLAVVIVLVVIVVVIIRVARRHPAETVDASATAPGARLRNLEQLHDEGLLSDEEFQAKRREILGRM